MKIQTQQKKVPVSVFENCKREPGVSVVNLYNFSDASERQRIEEAGGKICGILLEKLYPPPRTEPVEIQNCYNHREMMTCINGARHDQLIISIISHGGRSPGGWEGRAYLADGTGNGGASRHIFFLDAFVKALGERPLGFSRMNLCVGACDASGDWKKEPARPGGDWRAAPASPSPGILRVCDYSLGPCYFVCRMQLATQSERDRPSAPVTRGDEEEQAGKLTPAMMIRYLQGCSVRDGHLVICPINGLILALEKYKRYGDGKKKDRPN